MTNICRWLFLLYFLTTWTVITNSKEIRVVCYYTNWSVYRPGTAKFSPQNINPYLCTHLVYAFGGFTKENTLKPFDKYQDIEKGGYAKFTGLKTYNKNLKTLLAIGGWNEGSSRFSPMVANADRRKELIKNAIKFLRQNHFDGLDLDWEYPSFRDGGKARDKDNYAQLVQELREEFERESEKTGRPRLLLTMAVPAGIEYINKGYDIPKLTKYLDWMNILSYDYHSAFEPAVNHHAPMYSLEEDSEYNYDADLNIDHTVKHYLKLGALPNKLVVGIPTYGRSYTLFNSDANEIGAPADGPGDMGEATRENGYLAYYEICDYVKSQGWEVVQPNPDAMGPYAFKENQWVGYDDQAIARKKAEYVVENDLGGIMFWSIDNDDFRGNCHGKPYPIIEAAKEALIQASGLTDENLISPKKPTKTKPRTRTRLTTSTTTVATVERKKNRRRNRISSKSEETKARRKEVEKTAESLTHSSLKVVTPAYTTPEPPSTPDGGGSFKCEDEGFFPHPKDCKKYFWCLSGAGGLGIVAHQFTCPAGLYFNKAADSCDYTQNVLCNKKIQKTTTTTTSTTVAPKTTSKSATSRPSLPRTTTTEAPVEEEYEEYDDEEDIIDKNAEEDPKVIKELLDLIRKAGGIEELEKQLNFQDSGSKAGSNSSFNKHLVQKVLSTRKTLTSGQRGSFINRNSRGPQNEGIEKDSIRDKEKSRPKYVTLARDKTKTKTDEDEVEESQDKRTSNKLEYTNIRRGRISSTTEAEEGANLNRNKLGEDELEEYEDDEINTTRKSVTTPQYVNIRRQRPSTTEGTTSKYIEIRRGSTTEAPLTTIEENVTQRGSTTTSVPEQSKTRGTTTKSSQADELTKYKTIQRGSTSTTTESSEIRSTTLDDIISRLTTLVAGSSASTESATTQPPIIISSTQRTLINLENTGADVIRTKPPQLFEPRPFSISTQTTSIRPITETTTTKVTKVSESNSIRTRRPSRFSFSTTEQSRTPNPTQRSRKRFTTTTTENSLNYEELDLGRNFRPSEIADLSSLTAVDIGVVKGAGNRFGSSRRRIISTTHRPKIDRRPITINDLSDLVESGSDVNKSVSSTEKPSFRNRKIIRRLRPSTTSISRVRSTTETIRAAETSSSPLFRRRISRFSTTTSLDNIKPVTVAPLQSRRFTKSTKLDVTTEKLKTDRNDDVEDEADNEASEEGENIKLSESNIRENNDINNNNRISSEDGKKIRTKVLKRVTNSDVIDQEEQEEEVPRIRFNFRDRLVIQEKTTEPNVIKRTRKIIRKLTTESTTPTSTTESAEVTLGRKRKIIRRLRPTVATKINKLEDRNEGDKLKEANKIRFRPRSTTVSSIEEHNSSSTAAATEKEFTENKTFTEQQIKTVQTLVKENDSTTLKDEDLNEEIVETTSVITETDEDTELTTIVLPTTEGKSTTPYVNRILEKQRNRPVFVRPKLTTQSPTSTTTVKTRFRGNRFSTISTPRPTTESRYSRRSTTPRTTSSTTSTTTPSTTSSVETTSTTVSPSTTTVTATSLADTSTSGATTSRIITTPEDETEDIITTFDNEIFDKTTVESTTETLTKLRTSTEEIDSTIPPVGETTTEEHFYDTTIILHDLSTSRIPKEDEEPETTIIDQTTSTSLIIENLSWKSSTPVTTSPASTTESPETSTSQNFESSTVETESRPITESENLSSTPRNRFILRGKTTEKPATEEKLTTARSRLSFRDRNKVKTTETSEDTVDAKVEPSKPTSRRRFNYRGRTTEKTAENEEVEAQTVDQKPLIPVGRSRFLLKNKESAIKNKNSRTQSKEEVTEGQEESVEEPKSRLKPSRGFQNKKNKSISTESPKEEINADAIKARNRNLFSNKRKANTPFAGIKVESSTQTIKSTTYNEEPESNTLPSTIIPDTTDEYLSTLHHIFAEVEAEMETTTPLNTKNNSESKVEKLIEVSRITEVHNNDDSKEERILIDKIGAINRVTSIKIVDPKDNEIFINNLEVATVKQVPNNNNNRQDRKYEIYGNSKVSSSKTNNVKAEIIGGLSNINVITPRPYYSTEASTIALEGLFQTTPKKLLDNQDELLETDNSKFVSVRVLEQDNGRDFGFRDDTEIVPIKVLPQDEYIKARVVEVTPSSKNEKIKIVPIKFEMSRKIRGRRRTTTTPKPTTTPRAPTTQRNNLKRRRPTTSSKISESQEVVTSLPKYQFVPRRSPSRTSRPRISLTTSTESADQTIESSNQQSKEDVLSDDTTELSDIATALHLIQKAPLPSVRTTSIPKTTKRPQHKRGPTRGTARPSTQAINPTTKFLLKKKPIQKLSLKTSEYDSFEDQSVLQLGQIPEHSKVLLHSNGVIECLDQGSFPHPISCRKFISCAKMENGNVLGWEYTCPKNLSFDPIGGMCNWSPELGCNE